MPAHQDNEAATAPEVNNSEAASKNENESDSDGEAEPETDDVKQDAVADLYDYQMARVTPLDWTSHQPTRSARFHLRHHPPLRRLVTSVLAAAAAAAAAADGGAWPRDGCRGGAAPC
jgi:hypothetical protein